MKKVLEDELMSLAHRILKLRNRADVHELKEEAALLYEKLSILSFVEKHFEGVKPTIRKYEIERSIQQEFNLEHTKNLNYPDGTEYNEEPIYEHNTEKIKDIVSQMPFEAQVVDELFDEPEKNVPDASASDVKPEDIPAESKKDGNIENDSENDDVKQEEVKDTTDKAETKDLEDMKVEDPVEVEDFGVHFDDLPDFEPAEENKEELKEEKQPKEVKSEKEAQDSKKNDKSGKEDHTEEEKPQRTMDLFSQNKKSLNDKLNNNLKIGLNDRLSFVNHLFKGNSKTYESFIGSINTLDSLAEVKEFLNEQIQDKYEFWKDKEEIANRLLHLIEIIEIFWHYYPDDVVSPAQRTQTNG